MDRVIEARISPLAPRSAQQHELSILHDLHHRLLLGIDVRREGKGTERCRIVSDAGQRLAHFGPIGLVPARLIASAMR